MGLVRFDERRNVAELGGKRGPLPSRSGRKPEAGVTQQLYGLPGIDILASGSLEATTHILERSATRRTLRIGAV